MWRQTHWTSNLQISGVTNLTFLPTFGHARYQMSTPLVELYQRYCNIIFHMFRTYRLVFSLISYGREDCESVHPESIHLKWHTHTYTSRLKWHTHTYNSPEMTYTHLYLAWNDIHTLIIKLNKHKLLNTPAQICVTAKVTVSFTKGNC